ASRGGSKSQPRLRRAERGRDAGRRARLARDLHAVRFGLFRRRDVPAGTDRQSVRPESVTYVLGMNCHPCVRNGPLKVGAPGRTGTCDPGLEARLARLYFEVVQQVRQAPRTFTHERRPQMKGEEASRRSLAEARLAPY